jgi:hypothetical protein
MTTQEAIALYYECGRFGTAYEVLMDDDSPLRRKTKELLYGQDMVRNMQTVCLLVYHTLAQAYMERLEDELEREARYGR